MMFSTDPPTRFSASLRLRVEKDVTLFGDSSLTLQAVQCRSGRQAKRAVEQFAVYNMIPALTCRAETERQTEKAVTTMKM